MRCQPLPNGRQYVAITSDGGSFNETVIPTLGPESAGHLPQATSTLFVFALPEDGANMLCDILSREQPSEGINYA